VLNFVIIQRTISTLMITKFATPFYPERFIRGNLNILRNRLNRTVYEFIKVKAPLFFNKRLKYLTVTAENAGKEVMHKEKLLWIS
jgi:hypothetical protein